MSTDQTPRNRWLFPLLVAVLLVAIGAGAIVAFRAVVPFSVEVSTSADGKETVTKRVYWDGHIDVRRTPK